MIQRDEFDWRIRFNNYICQSDNDAMGIQITRRKTRTMELLNVFKRNLFLWSGTRKIGDRPPMDELMQGFLYCILRETPRVQRLLLQFPPAWGTGDYNLEHFARLQMGDAPSTPEFCSSLTELMLLPASESQTRRSVRSIVRRSPLGQLHSLRTLTTVGSGMTFDPFRYEALKSIRHLHFSNTALQPRTLCRMLLELPQDLVSLTLKQCPSNPFALPDIEDLPTTKTPTLSEALLLKGSNLQELTLVLCYTNCFKNFIGSSQRLTSLPTLHRLAKLTIQMHLLFGCPRDFHGDVDLASILPPNLVQLNIIDEWEMDIMEHEAWLQQYANNELEESDIEQFIHDNGLDTDAPHLCHVIPYLSVDSVIYSKYRLDYSFYRATVKKMLLDLATDCYAGQIGCHIQVVDEQQNHPKLASLRSVTYQVAPSKPLHLYYKGLDDVWLADKWPHVLDDSLVDESMEDTFSAIKSGSFLCWIPYRWTDINLLKSIFGIYYYEMSVRYIRDDEFDGKVESGAEEESSDVNEDYEDYKDYLSEDGDEVDEDSENDENDEVVVQPEPKLLALWNAFRNIPREHFTDVTAAFAKSGIQFDCFGDSRPWLMAIRDAAKVELQEKGLCEEVMEDDL